MPATSHEHDQSAAEQQPLNRAARRAARKGRAAEVDQNTTQNAHGGPVHGSQVMASRHFTGRRGNR